MNIWQQLPRHFTALAPMEGVTDIVFRQVIAKAGRPDLFFTEFTNVSSYASEKGRQNALERLRIAESDPPIIAQIWGKNPDHFAKTAGILESLGFSGLDINMGCPDRHVNKAGGGAAMIKTPDLAVECIKKAKESTSLPVSVKTRLGFTYLEEYQTWLPLLLKQNLAALTVHLRTRKEMSKVPAHYELIPKIIDLRDKIAPGTKLIINGDIKNLAHAKRLWQQYPEVDGMMIGRGVFEDPFCFRQQTSQMQSKEDTLDKRKRSEEDVMDENQLSPHNSSAGILPMASPEGHTERGSASLSAVRPWRWAGRTRSEGDVMGNTPTKELLELFKYHLNLFDAYDCHPFELLKHFFKIYINNFPGASDLRAQLMTCKSTDEVRTILSSHYPEIF